MNNQASRPREGIRVIEVGQLLAGPFAGTLLSYFGAEVIKVEPPQGGDPKSSSAKYLRVNRPLPERAGETLFVGVW